MGECFKFGRGIISIGKPASEYAVGESVFLLESGSPVEYLVVNQGVPSNSGLYDSSCDGTWLLRKNILNEVVWGTSSNYATSSAHSYMNGNMQYLFDETFLSKVKQVKIPYIKDALNSNSSLASGSNGLSAKFFLLSGYELGWTKSDSSSFPADGAKLDYFISGTATDANNKRIAYYNGSAYAWYLRSPVAGNSTNIWVVPTNGQGTTTTPYSNSRGLRPALILPFDAKFDSSTNILKS